MRFWKKFFAFVAMFIVFAVLQVYTESIGRFEVSVLDEKFSIEIYALLSSLIALAILLLILETVASTIAQLFRNKNSSFAEESIKSIAKLILSSDSDFENTIHNIKLSEKYKILRTALLLKRSANDLSKLDLTSVDFIDIYILKKRLQNLIDASENTKALELANHLIKRYSKYLKIVEEELLNVAVLAKKNNIDFAFNPKKHKYHLSRSFADRYFSALDLAAADMAASEDLKQNILERAHKHYPNNPDIAISLLNFAFGKYGDKKMIEILKHTFEQKPDRQLVHHLLKLKRNDAFEIAQEISAEVSSNNLEKLWFLLIVATKLDFISKANELIIKIVEIDATDDILSFYIKYQSKFSNETTILNALKKRIK